MSGYKRLRAATFHSRQTCPRCGAFHRKEFGCDFVPPSTEYYHRNMRDAVVGTDMDPEVQKMRLAGALAVIAGEPIRPAPIQRARHSRTAK